MKKKKSSAASVIKSIKTLTKRQVYVGITAETNNRSDGKLNNAEIAFLNTNGVRTNAMISEMDSTGQPYSVAHQMYLESHGSPAFRVPPRPIIQPAIEAEDNKAAIAEQLKLAGQAIIEGDEDEALIRLNKAGQTAANRVKAWFTDPLNHWLPNAPSTIKKKGSDRPLIDKGNLRKAISYVVSQGD